MRVLVILEDFRNDQYMALPIIREMMKAVGKPKAKVDVVRDPFLTSVSQALSEQQLRKVIQVHKGMTDLFILCVDRDCEEGRSQVISNLEKNLAEEFNVVFIGENAWQELEVWLLAGHKLPPDWSWETIRKHREPKEAYYEPFAIQKKVSGGPGGGRKVLGLEAARSYAGRIRRLCHEVKSLEVRISESFA